MTENQFKEIIERYSQPILNIIHKMIHQQETAYDLSQDVFLKLWQHRKNLDDSKPVFTFIYKIAINLSIDYLRKKPPDLIENNMLDLMNTNSYEEQEEIFNLIMRCSSELKPKQKAIFLLRDIEGFSFEEIADTLKMSVNNIRSNLHLARKKIRHLLESKYQLTWETLYDL
jgi:RNA polymerase sigma-70 factor (ECF subfamily)